MLTAQQLRQLRELFRSFGADFYRSACQLLDVQPADAPSLDLEFCDDEAEKSGERKAEQKEAEVSPTPPSYEERKEEKKDDNNNDIKKERQKRFRKPTVHEVTEYVERKGYHISAEHFHAYYESNGWRVGMAPMKDWRAACRVWEQKELQLAERRRNYAKHQAISRSRTQEKPNQTTNNYGQDTDSDFRSYGTYMSPDERRRLADEEDQRRYLEETLRAVAIAASTPI